LWQNFPFESKALTVSTNIFCVPKHGDDTEIILPRPKWAGSRTKNSGLPFICEQQSISSFEEFVRFPEFYDRKEKDVWQGIIATGLVFDDNPIVRWASLRTPIEPQTKTWVAYSIADACGALPEGFGGLAHYGVTYFLPPLKGPYVPTLKMNGEGLRSKLADLPPEFGLPLIPTEFNLLRIPTPRALMEKGRIHQWYGADWSLCEEYYSEHKTPAWKLTITNDSKPYRESFCIEHALDDSGQEIWKLIVFATIEPKDLLQVICKLKGIDPNQIQIGELEMAYEELNAVREKLLNR
jgi:hypothetical protein